MTIVTMQVETALAEVDRKLAASAARTIYSAAEFRDDLLDLRNMLDPHITAEGN